MCQNLKPSESLQAFKDFMGTATTPGEIDANSKEMIVLALSLALQCAPCSKIHVKKAREMGISEDAIAEIVSLATMFGGVKSMMLWNEVKD
jgi:AhpD family alkylhydroperoxidase